VQQPAADCVNNRGRAASGNYAYNDGDGSTFSTSNIGADHGFDPNFPSWHDLHPEGFAT